MITELEKGVFLLENSDIRVKIMAYGATILSVETRDREGKAENVTLSLNSLKDYLKNPCYAGVVVGPTAGRIRNGEFEIDNQLCRLEKNDGAHNLHGGSVNLSHTLWTVERSFENNGIAALELSVELADGEQGFIGNRKIRLSYSLDRSNTLTLKFGLETDKKTFMSLTNHAYWNLSGDFAASALDHKLQIFAKEVLCTDGDHLPREKVKVENSMFDFTSPAILSENLSRTDLMGQREIARGYDHAFILDNRDIACILIHEKSGRKMVMRTDLPALVFYSGGFLSGETVAEKGIPATPACALALEAGRFPDEVNLDWVPCEYLIPGEPVTHFISWQFGICE